MDTTDYDHVQNIAIGPSGMDTTATSLSKCAQEIADSITRIENALKSLTLNGWAGKTQQEADDFNNRWVKVMGDLFGSKDKPNDGVLNAMANGIYTAVKNYDEAEYGLVDVWKRFAGKLPKAGVESSVPTPSKDTPPDQLDTNKTAITADYPPYVS
ncbi:WXG100 family type VII secretion target [Actinoallomurus rhizosphaericola]|uniref:WXG100 family type VII secretion target n=1 Tax=Actinoallomurus rhizosphaericola TaxID=2952536 RepID=UPI002093D5C8|nr:WXG100 family type VII secretion target [Actinoallomurus rhizosphaericola]MCO6000324.1 WXG100 family type VII secretion target [Actinoallomurus rhizosphaericola]